MTSYRCSFASVILTTPKTVEEVDPNNLEASFGKGIKLVSATLQMTDEEVTTGVDKWLGWLEKTKGWIFGDGQFASFGNKLSSELNGGDFERK